MIDLMRVPTIFEDDEGVRQDTAVIRVSAPNRIVTPSRRMVRTNHQIESPIAPAVNDSEIPVRSIGKALAGAVRSSHRTTAPLRNMASAQRNETRTKNR